MLVATKAKPNRNMNSSLNREFYNSFLDVSLSMYLFLQKFLRILQNACTNLHDYFFMLSLWFVFHLYNEVYINEIITLFLAGSKPPSTYWKI